MTTALIDADIVAFRCAASAENEPEEIAVLRADKLMRDILYLTDCSTYVAYLTGKGNFRKEIYPEYKANRKDKPKPIHLQAVREYLVANFDAHVTDGCEADDLLAIAHTGENTVLCSIDKDLLQVPGKHYNFVKNEWIDVSELGGLRRFYEQLLKGDKTDNIPGIDGIGEKKAQRYLEGCITEQDMFNTVRNIYNDDDTMIRNGKLLWVWREVGGTWNPEHLLTGQNHLEPEEEVNAESTQEMQTETNQCTAHTTMVQGIGS